MGCQERCLSSINYHFITEICQILGVNTQITWSLKYQLMEGKTEKLVDLCNQVVPQNTYQDQQQKLISMRNYLTGKV
jgi:hypothetical protein